MRIVQHQRTLTVGLGFGLSLLLLLALLSHYEEGVREALHGWSSTLEQREVRRAEAEDGNDMPSDSDSVGLPAAHVDAAVQAPLPSVDADPKPPLVFPAMRVCGRWLCITVLPTNATGLVRAPPRRAEPPFELMYFPTIPRSGNTYTRKLWESTTGVASESVFREEKSVDRRTGAFYHKCGMALSSLGGSGAGADCDHVHAPTHHSPALVKSHDKIFPRLDMVRKMTSLLVIVRNPLDNFVSDLLDRNRVFVEKALRRLANSTSPVKYTAPDLARLKLPVFIPVKKWVPTYWASYLNLWLLGNNRATCQSGKGKAMKKSKCKLPQVPTYVIRFEDLHRDPAAIMVDMLQATGIASALNITSDRVKVNVARVNQGTATLNPGDAADCRSAFDYVAPTRSDAEATLAMLRSHQRMLDHMGYKFELNDAGERTAAVSRET